MIKLIFWSLTTIILTFQPINLNGQIHKDKFQLHKLNYITDSCGDPNTSSTLYIQHWGTLIDIDSVGNFVCNLAFDLKDSSNIRNCNIKLAGIMLDQNSESTINTLRKLLTGEKIKVNTAQSKSTVETDFEGLVLFDGYIINYSLLLSGLATFRYEKYTLDFWTRCKFEEAEEIGQKQLK